ncbi:MAG TPA: histidine kinase, partial [Cellulomonas sp.]
MTTEAARGARGGTPQVRAVLVAAGTWLVTVGLATALPLLDRVEPELAGQTHRAGDARWWLLVAVVTAASAALVGVPVRAAVVPLVVAGLALGAAPALPADLFTLTSVPVLVAVYLAGVQPPHRRARWTVPATFALVAAGYLVAALPLPVSDLPVTLLAALAQVCVLVLGPTAVAVVVTARRDVQTARLGEVRALAREHDALVQAAVAEERTALARELHDIAAHHLAGIAVMASAVERQVDTAPADAKAGIRQVRQQSTVMLQDLRRLVGLLRDDEAETAVRSLAGVPALVATAGAGGRAVVLHRHSRAGAAAIGDGVGPLAQLAGYRMVQESLANAARHAPGARCTVDLDDRDDAAVVLVVRNAATAQVPVRAPG